LDDGVVVFGEVGLGGEVRSANSPDRRIAEAKKLGFTKAIAPQTSKKNSFVSGVKDLRAALIEYSRK
jgi:DNA repair protein RadA/Sms